MLRRGGEHAGWLRGAGRVGGGADVGMCASPPWAVKSCMPHPPGLMKSCVPHPPWADEVMCASNPLG